MREITKKDIIKWRNNTIKVAKKLKFHDKLLQRYQKKYNQKEIFSFILNKVPIKLTKGFPPKNNWFGWCHYDFGNPNIEIYNKNLSTVSHHHIIKALQQDNIPQEKIKKIVNHMKSISQKKFFEVYNQSGMDHEIMGHLFHYLKGVRHDEEISVKIQIKFAKYRAKKIGGKKWKEILKIMPMILGHHKNIDELKN